MMAGMMSLRGVPPMLDAAVKALSQMFSPPFRTVLAKSIGLALILIILFGIGLHQVLTWLTAPVRAGGERVRPELAHAAVDPDKMLAVAAALGIIVGSVFLMPAVTALVASFFADEIAAEVERSHYPNEPAGMPCRLRARSSRASRPPCWRSRSTSLRCRSCCSRALAR